MRKVIQKRIVKLIQPEIVRYFCDRCGKRFKKGEKKKRYFNAFNRKTEHYHEDCDNKRQGWTV